MPTMRVSPIYAELGEEMENIVNGFEHGFYNDEPTTARPKKFYRAVFWNLEGEFNYRHLLDVIKNHPVLRRADFFLLANADVGMGRSQNANVVRSLALELNYNYVFTCSYLHLNLHPLVTFAPNELGLVGQAVMTPHPLAAFETVAIDPLADTMCREVKRIGCEKALIVRVALPYTDLDVVCAKLDSGSSPRRRARQIDAMFSRIGLKHKNQAVLCGAGLNTTTYDSRHAVPQFFSFFNKVLRGYDYICEEHHAFPEKYFDRRVFDAFERAGFHYADLNETGVPTLHCPFEELEVQGCIGKKISHMMVGLIRRFFYHGPEHLGLKVDWFSGNAPIRPSVQPQAEKPKVLANLYHDSQRISSHHPIVLDFEIA